MGGIQIRLRSRQTHNTEPMNGEVPLKGNPHFTGTKAKMLSDLSEAMLLASSITRV